MKTNSKVVRKEIKPVYSVDTVLKGKINWVAQAVGKVSDAKLEHYRASLREKLIRVEIRELK